jgi:solute carrier family 6 GABA transporter-like protein 6/8/11/12/13
MVQHKPLLYEKTYLYPAWAEGVAWIIIFLSVGWIPLGAMHELLGRKGTCLAVRFVCKCILIHYMDR